MTNTWNRYEKYRWKIDENIWKPWKIYGNNILMYEIEIKNIWKRYIKYIKNILKKEKLFLNAQNI